VVISMYTGNFIILCVYSLCPSGGDVKGFFYVLVERL